MTCPLKSNLFGDLTCHHNFISSVLHIILPFNYNALPSSTTEEESWSLISVDSSFATTPKSFLVKSADGSIRKYGSDTGVFRYPDPDGDSAIGWLIDYQEDIDGNYIEYAYSYKDGIPYISEIRYGAADYLRSEIRPPDKIHSEVTTCKVLN